MSLFSGSTIRRRVIGVLTVGLAPVTVATGVAWAAAVVTDNMFPTPLTNSVCRTGMTTPGSPCQTDNAAVYYYMDSSGDNKLEAEDKAEVRSVMSGEFAPTALSITYDSTPVFSGSGETDIVYQESSSGLSDSSVGMTWCNALGGGSHQCDQQYVRIRGGGGYSYDVVCHETGHAVGLQHGNRAYPTLSNTDYRLGCMTTPVRYLTLRENNVGNINATY